MNRDLLQKVAKNYCESWGSPKDGCDYTTFIDGAEWADGHADESTSDGYHTMGEYFEQRLLYNAAFFNELSKQGVCHVIKSKRHNTGEACFGGGWFIVMAELPTGQISNHYELSDWDLFKCEEVEIAPEWDGHTPAEAMQRIRQYLKL